MLDAPVLDLATLEDLPPTPRTPADDALAPPAGRVEVLTSTSTAARPHRTTRPAPSCPARRAAAVACCSPR